MAVNLPTLPTGPFDFRRKPEEKKGPDLSRLTPRRDVPDRLEWTMKYRRNLGPGRKFDIDNHLYLVDIYRESAKEIVLMKASQMGASEWMVSYAIHACDQRIANVLYVFPTEGHVSDFSTARLGPAIEASWYLDNIVIDGSGAGGMRGSDRITLKRIRDRFLYFRGSKVQTDGNAPQLKSIDADVLMLDEVDELDPRAPAIARKRLGHAREDLGNILQVSTPTYPGLGIHAAWNESDQRRWFIRCEHCGERQPLTIEQVVTHWDDLQRPLDWHGKSEHTAWVACIRCGSKLDRLSQGEWVAEYPDRPVVGYHLTKLFSAQMDLLQVVLALDTVDETKRKEAFNQDLGIPYLPKGGNLDEGTLDACRREYLHGPDFRQTAYMGVDIGKLLHVVVRTGTNLSTGETRQLYAGETTWDNLPRLVKIYRPRTIVVDALPETTKAREFQEMYPRNMVWIAYYPNMPQGSKKEDFCVWDPKDRKVLIDRTRSLDNMVANFQAGVSTLPLHARNIRDYYSHMRTSVRVLKEDSSGQEVARWMETGADHYFHAESYCNVASRCRIGRGWVQAATA